MGAAMEVLTGYVVNPGAAFTALTMASGDSLQVRNFDLNAGATIQNIWASGASGGVARVRSPRLHDNVQGIRLGYLSAGGYALLPEELDQMLYPQDVLIAEMTGGAAETDVMCMLMYYNNLSGAASQLRKWSQVQPNIKNIVGVEVDMTSNATPGNYGAGLAINTNFDLLKANTNYALLGYESPVALANIGMRSPDFGNYRIGMPGNVDRLESRRWFIKNDIASSQPWIPVFNSANKGSTFCDIVATTASVTANVQFILAELSA